MAYNFDELVDRMNTACAKWDGLEQRFGVSDAIPMWVADMDFRAPLPVIEALKNRAEHGVFGYTIKPDSYFEAILSWLERRHHFTALKEWLCHSPGVVPALGLIVSTFTEPGDKVIIQTPVYYPFRRVIEVHDRQVVRNPLKYEDGYYTMDFADLEQKVRLGAKMLILCSPHNPVGRVWKPEELVQLGEICCKHNVLVVSDEIHSDLVYKAYTHTPFASISENFARHSITCIAPSKTFNLAGLQTSTVIIPNPDLRKRYMQTLDKMLMGAMNVFGLVAAESAYRYGEEWLDELLDYLKGNLDFLTEYIEQRIPKIKVIQPEGTYLVWLDCRELGMDLKGLDEFLLKEAKLALDEGHIFGAEGEGFSRINIACPRTILENALENLESAVRKR